MERGLGQGRAFLTPEESFTGWTRKKEVGVS